MIRKLRTIGSSRPKQGFVLVFVLLMLTLAAAIAGQASSRTVRLVGQAASSQRELQARWAVVSIRRSVLSQARELLTSESQSTGEPPSAARRWQVNLSGASYDIVLEDESAKAPIRRFLQSKSQVEVKPVLRKLIETPAILSSVIPPNIDRWQQVFTLPPSVSQSQSLSQLRNSLSRSTLWSDGRINLRTADPSVIDAAWQLQFNASAPSFLQNMKLANENVTIDSLVLTLGLPERQSDWARQWLSLESTCHSVWIQQTNPQRSSFSGVFVRVGQQGFADEHFGFRL
jgi:hypothetical protein